MNRILKRASSEYCSKIKTFSKDKNIWIGCVVARPLILLPTVIDSTCVKPQNLFSTGVSERKPELRRRPKLI